MSRYFLVLLLLPVLATAQEATSSPGPAPDTPQPLHLQFEAQAPAQAPIAPVRSAYPAVVPASSPLRRTTPIESRLTCDDYSKAYFARHPAMAEVCNVDPAAEPEPTAMTPCGPAAPATPTSPTTQP